MTHHFLKKLYLNIKVSDDQLLKKLKIDLDKSWISYKMLFFNFISCFFFCTIFIFKLIKLKNN